MKPLKIYSLKCCETFTRRCSNTIKSGIVKKNLRKRDRIFLYILSVVNSTIKMILLLLYSSPFARSALQQSKGIKCYPIRRTQYKTLAKLRQTKKEFLQFSPALSRRLIRSAFNSKSLWVREDGGKAFTN